MEEIKAKIDKARVVSFDVFDTLIVRPYLNPDHVLKGIEHKYGIKNFFRNRTKAANRAYALLKDGREDTTLPEIYAQYKKEELNGISIEDLVEIESREEIHVSMQNKKMHEIYNYALNKGKVVIIASDMYLPQRTIENILEKNGYSGYSKLYVSSSYSKLKRTGSLYNVILSDMKEYKPGDILHIGDNYHSDVLMAKSKGIDAILLEQRQTSYKEDNSFPCLKNASDLNLSISIAAMTAALNFEKIETFEYWKRFGYEFAGPMLFNFVKWINDIANKEEVDGVIFIARDGYLLQKIFNKINKRVHTHYVYAPRSTNLYCQLNYEKSGRFTLEHTTNIINYYREKSDIVRRFPACQSAEENVRLIEENREEFDRLANAEMDSYKSYLINQGVTGEKILTVDSVSMFFSAQKLFEKILGKKTIGLYYLIQRGADLKDMNVCSYKQIGNYSKECLMAEFLMTSNEPPVSCVKDGIVIHKSANEHEINRIKCFEKIASGVMEFVDDVIMMPNSTSFVADSDAMSVVINDFINNPSKKDRKMFASEKFATDPAHEQFQVLFPEWYSKRRLIENKLFSVKKVYENGRRIKYVSIAGFTFKFTKRMK